MFAASLLGGSLAARLVRSGSDWRGASPRKFAAGPLPPPFDDTGCDEFCAAEPSGCRMSGWRPPISAVLKLPGDAERVEGFVVVGSGGAIDALGA